MKPDGSKEPQEELDEAMAELQVLEDAPASDRTKAVRRVLRAATTVSGLLEAGGASAPSPHTPYGEGGHTNAPAPSFIEMRSG